MSTVPPAVRWVPDGEHAGVYTWMPARQRWLRATLSGRFHLLVDDLPPGAQPLVPWGSVEHVIDFYWSLRPILADIGHEAAKAQALAELDEAADLPLYFMPAPTVGNSEQPRDDLEV